MYTAVLEAHPVG